MITRNISYVLPANYTPYAYCLYLTVDGTAARYVDITSTGCRPSTNTSSIGTAQANVTVYDSDYLSLQNGMLHDWLNTSSGDLGLSYNCADTACSDTSFQSILADAGSGALNQTFGLDFRDPNSTLPSLSGTASSMQMGGVSSAYTLYWQQQPTTVPAYHQIYIQQLGFCGAQILGNYSTNWQVLVDTGAACLTLPGEIYDNFAAWFSNSTVDSWADLPAFSFQVFGADDQLLYLPLAALILADDAILTEPGAPEVTSVQQGSARLCVLRGTNIENSFGDYTSPTPQVIFGSMALRPFYFAADFSNVSLALGSKLSASEVLYYANDSNPSCAAASACVGQQTYDPSSNTCNAPRCRRYFFQNVDPSGTECEYKYSAMVFGIVFISLIAAMETASYFIMQYTAHSLLAARDSSVTVDPFTVCVGRYLAFVADEIIYKVLKWQNLPPVGVIREDQRNALVREV